MSPNPSWLPRPASPDVEVVRFHDLDDREIDAALEPLFLQAVLEAVHLAPPR